MSILTEALKRLLTGDEPTLTASAFTTKQRQALEQFARDTRLLELVKQGRSTLYKVLNRQSILNYLRQQHPIDVNDLPADIPERSRNIGLDRNSKTGKTRHACYYLLMKAWDASVIWQDNTHCLPVAELTERFGVASLQIKADIPQIDISVDIVNNLNLRWQCTGPLLLVENQALFDQCDWLPADFSGCLIYYGGQLSDLLLHWFSSDKRADTIILFPDYDGVGLSNYVRLKQALPPETNLQFYWLPDWEDKLPRYGNAEVWLNTRQVFENAFQKLTTLDLLTDDFIKLGQLSQHYGKVLEQEAIWLTR
jgi:hypothetical protein